MNHEIVVFFDSDCGLCDHMVSFILKKDKKKQIYFSPLTGQLVKTELSEWIKNHSLVDSIVLVEKRPNKKIYYYSEACFRIAWHLGGFFAIPGLLSFLPRFLLYPFDVVYKIVAKRRKGFCARIPLDDEKIKYSDKFLP